MEMNKYSFYKIFFVLIILTSCFLPIIHSNGYIIHETNCNINWMDDWLYRADIEITSTHDSTLVNYTLRIELTNLFNYSLAKTNGGDIRFTDHNDAQLPFWIEKWNENGNSTIWVLIPIIEPDTSYRIFMYYGNLFTLSIGRGDQVFRYFDDFENQGLGEEPEGWHIKQREWGSFEINSNSRIGDSSCYYIDNSTAGSCRFYKKFSENIIEKNLEFWIKPKYLSDSGILCYNDNNNSYIGGSTYFGHDTSVISHYDGSYHSLLSPFQAENWYFFSIQLVSINSYNQIIYDENGTLLVSANNLPYLGNPSKIDYFMNGGNTLSTMAFYIDAIRYRDYVSNEPIIEITDYQQIKSTNILPIFSGTFEILAIVVIGFLGATYLIKKTKKE
ncbi:MAG: DUF2341 domain-containing protein [Asgard group archaeon]|nr:DUF2341 domain-containing protein [Asgard group archaeon]